MEKLTFSRTGCLRYNYGTLGIFFARVVLMKLSDVPEKAYNLRSSEFGGFFVRT